MSVLSTQELAERIYQPDPKDPRRIFIVPMPPRNSIKDPSIDLLLGNHFIVTKTAKFSVLDACGDQTEKDIVSYQERVIVPFGKHIILHPGTFVLGVTWQYVGLPCDIQAQVGSRSTWGRAGLTVATAVVVHPFFAGCLTLELVNNGNAPIALYPGSRIAQMTFLHTGASSSTPGRSSKYAGMTEPAFTRLHDEKRELQRWRLIGEQISFQGTSASDTHPSPPDRSE